MRTEWPGYYLDGQRADRRAVTLYLQPEGIQARTPEGVLAEWSYPDISLAQGTYAGEPVRLEHGGEFPEVLVVTEPGFLQVLTHMTPRFGGLRSSSRRGAPHLRIALIAGLGIIALALGLYVWGIPAVTAFAAARVPVAWEERLGESLVPQVAPEDARCDDPDRLARLDQMAATLAAPLPAQPYTFRLLVVNEPTLNALALPGGTIVLYRGLIERTRRAEELAGVLAHEMQHILQRHATHALLRYASTGLLFSALTGGQKGLGAGLQVLQTLQYSRQNETAADTAGMRLMIDAGLDPQGMIRIFETFQTEGANMPDLLQYVSTHPATDERLTRLRQLAEDAPAPRVQLLPDYDWADMHRICSTTP